jgi:hypothetical protein
LLDWAREQEVDLNRLTVGRPTLEDAYLALTSGINAEGGFHEDA